MDTRLHNENITFVRVRKAMTYYTTMWARCDRPNNGTHIIYKRQSGRLKVVTDSTVALPNATCRSIYVWE